MNITKLNKKRIVKNLIILNLVLLTLLIVFSGIAYFYLINTDMIRVKKEQEKEAGFVCNMVKRYLGKSNNRLLIANIQRYELNRGFNVCITDANKMVLYSSINKIDYTDLFKYKSGQYTSNGKLYLIKTLRLKEAGGKNTEIKIIVLSKNVLSELKNQVLKQVIYKGGALYLIIAYILSMLVLIVSRLSYDRFQTRIFGDLIKSTNDGVVVTNEAGIIVFANDSFLRIFNNKLNQVLGTSMVQFYSEVYDNEYLKVIKAQLNREGVWNGELVTTLDDGNKIFTKVKVNEIVNKKTKAKYYIVIYEDKTDYHMQKVDVLRLQLYDMFSGLPNRNYMKKYLRKFINCKMEFIYINICLENFKEINESFGFEIANKIYLQYLEKIKNIFGSNVFIGRIDGRKICAVLDAFEVLKLNQILKDICDISKKAFTIYSENVFISSTVSVFSYLDFDGGDIEKIFNVECEDIDLFMQGDSYAKIFKLIGSIESEKNKMIELMKNAVNKSEFSLSYQPRIDSKNKQLVGAEALIRWNNAEYGNISPMYFIPLAEKCGYIDEITEWTVRELCSQLKEWKDKYKKVVPVSINISPQSIKKEGFINRLISEVDKRELKRNDIQIEITEKVIDSVYMDAGKAINKLSKAGFKIFIDNFGAGNSKLNYLKNLDINALKIDREFIKNYPDKDDGNIAKLIIDMGKSLNISIIGEGTETPEQVSFLECNGCHIFQGYYFYKPLDNENFESVMENSFTGETNLLSRKDK